MPVLQEASGALGKAAEIPEPKPKSSLISQTGRPMRDKIGQTVPYSSEFDFEKLHRMVQEQEVRVKGLKQQAEQANNAVSFQCTNSNSKPMLKITAQSLA